MHISSKKKTMLAKNRCGEFIIKIIIIICIIETLNYLLKGDIRAITRVQLNELQEESYIDILFLGASHTQVGFDVNMIEKKTGYNLFNGGTAAQQLMSSYYLLREAYEKKGVNKVFLDITYTMQKANEPGKRETYIVADYLKKYRYALAYKAFGMQGIINEILPFLHNNDQTAIKDIKYHFTKDYIDNPYKYIGWEGVYYGGQGFVGNYNELEDKIVLADTHYLQYDNLMSEFALEYLYKIMEYCKENEIELIIINLPMPDVTLLDAGDYQIFVDFLSQIADENNVEYWDFNLIKKECLVLEPSDFNDRDHLSSSGAKKMSDLIASIINGLDTKTIFYNTFQEKTLKNSDGTCELEIVRSK